MKAYHRFEWNVCDIDFMTITDVQYYDAEGNYSDYHIEKIFTKKEDAEKYIEQECMNGEIEEYQLVNRYVRRIREIESE